MRLIDADALKENLHNKMLSDTDEMRLSAKLFYENITRAFLEEIDKEPTAMQAWTPYEEKPPEKDSYYIATFESNSGLRGVTPALYMSDSSKWSVGNIVAWMPYPEPWKPNFKQSEGKENATN